MSIAIAKNEFSERWRAMWIYWPTLLGAAFLITLATWYMGGTDVNFTLAMRILLVGGIVSILFLQWIPEKYKLINHAIVQILLSIILLEAIWLSIGALNVTIFLILFVFPVFSSALLSNGWLEYLVAIFIVVATAITVFISSSEFQWYIHQFSVFPVWLYSPQQEISSAIGHEGFLDGHDQLIALVIFSISIFGVAFLSGAAARALNRVERDLNIATRFQHESEDLASRLLDETQVIESFVSKLSGRIIYSNAEFRKLVNSENESNKTILEVLNPIYPEDIQRMMASSTGGEVSGCVCRINGEYRFLDISVKNIKFDGESVWRAQIRDTRSVELAASAFDSFGLAILIIGSNQQILFSSESFLQLFPRAFVGGQAAHALNNSYNLPEMWWDLAPRRQDRVTFVASDRRYIATVHISGTHAESALTQILVQLDSKP